MPYQLLNTRTQRTALQQLAQMAQRGMIDPVVRRAAGLIVRNVAARDDMAELQAIFDAVKTGTPNVPGLENGVRYCADPLDADYFTGPAQLLRECAAGNCMEDCDSQAALVAALAGSLGFMVGLRAYGSTSDYEHVYPVALYSKNNPTRVLGMDTTVPSSTLGWEPPQAKVLTAWIT